jgi:hypothetical protein
MNEQLKQTILEGLEKTLQTYFYVEGKQIQIPRPANLDEGLRSFSKSVQEFAKWLEKYGTRESLAVLLDQIPDIEPEIEAFIGSVFGYMPALFPFAVEFVGDWMKSQCPRPAGGHPRALSVVNASRVCLSVGELFSKGIPLKIAKMRTGQRFGVSTHTVERIWRSRAKPEAYKPGFGQVRSQFRQWLAREFESSAQGQDTATTTESVSSPKEVPVVKVKVKSPPTSKAVQPALRNAKAK